MRVLKEYVFTLPDQKKITAQFSDLADQANGSVIVRSGDTVVLATAVMNEKEREDIDYFPLVVDYEEKFYAAGLVLGGRFMRREGRPSDEAVLNGRIVDRTIRPLFNHALRREVQVIITVLSLDEENDPDVLSIIAASLALGVSDIPWEGPVGAVRICLPKNNDEFIINPTFEEREGARLDAIICGKNKRINMIETAAREIQEEKLYEALTLAARLTHEIENFQKNIIAEIGKEKLPLSLKQENPEISNIFHEHISEEKLTSILFNTPNHKEEMGRLKDEWLLAVSHQIGEEYIPAALRFFEKKVDEIIHREAIENNRRVDGRKKDEIRPIFAQAGGISNTLHGSGIFYRGGTHVLTVLTLGGPQDSLIIEGMEVRTKKFFMHHYNFPPFSSGEVGRVGGMNRRAIGHGALAEKALAAVIPSHDTFPYTIRLVSESLASNGSTSMASVCASTIALMDGGVPINAPVAGIAMGVMIDPYNPEKYAVLTDIQGPEDHHGDMDFKVAGTKNGITAIQMDVKVEGISLAILKDALEGAKKARLHILDIILQEIPSPRPKLKESAPRVVKLSIDIEKIGLLIGPGGKTVKQISDSTNTVIEIDQDGTVFITGAEEGVTAARSKIEELTREYKEGDRAEGTVSKIFDFGAVVEIAPNVEGLVHISELAPFHVNKVTDIVCPGERVPVIIKGVDERGRLSLSIVKADPDFAKNRGNKVCKNTSANTEEGYNKKDGKNKAGKWNSSAPPASTKQ